MRATPPSPGQSFDGAWLRRILVNHGIKPSELAKLLGISVDAVYSWMCSETSKRHRNIPDTQKRKILEIVK